MYPYRSIHSNIKRTRQWFQACGIQVPLGGTKFGFIRSISRTYSNVNTKSKNKFSTDTDTTRKSRSQRDVPTEQAERARPEAEEIARKWGLSGKKAETVRRGLADICESAGVGVRLTRTNCRCIRIRGCGRAADPSRIADVYESADVGVRLTRANCRCIRIRGCGRAADPSRIADVYESADVGVRLPRAELPTYTKPWMLTLSPPGFCGGARTL